MNYTFVFNIWIGKVNFRGYGKMNTKMMNIDRVKREVLEYSSVFHTVTNVCNAVHGDDIYSAGQSRTEITCIVNA